MRHAVASMLTSGVVCEDKERMETKRVRQLFCRRFVPRALLRAVVISEGRGNSDLVQLMVTTEAPHGGVHTMPRVACGFSANVRACLTAVILHCCWASLVAIVLRLRGILYSYVADDRRLESALIAQSMPVDLLTFVPKKGCHSIGERQ